MLYFFFFQAEDGIRDYKVTGVQTCALPIYAGLGDRVALRRADITELPPDLGVEVDLVSTVWALHHLPSEEHLRRCLGEIARIQIGRASCRERGEIEVGAVA